MGGLSEAAAARAAEGMARAAEALRASSGKPEFGIFVPGRIEVLGKHTDYAGGRSLLAAVEHGFALVGRRDAPGEMLILDADQGRDVHTPLAATPRTARGWGAYPAVVIRRIAHDFPGVRGGATLAFSSSLPPAAGMSSSSALIASAFLGAAEALDLPGRDDFRRAFGDGLAGGRAFRERLADYLAAAEAGRPFPPLGSWEGDGGVGTDGGSEDHVAILCGRSGCLVRYAFRPTRFEGASRVPAGWVFAVASSGVAAEKTAGARHAFNRLAEDARRAARLWRQETGGSEPHLGAILAAGPGAADTLAEILGKHGDTALQSRLRQFAIESNELVSLAALSIDAGDLPGFGAAVERSQALAEEVLGNQVPETIALVRMALDLGAPAASAFGAGFGGAVWALVREEDAEGFLDEWRTHYLARFPGREQGSRFLWSSPGPAAFRVGSPAGRAGCFQTL